MRFLSLLVMPKWDFPAHQDMAALGANPVLDSMQLSRHLSGGVTVTSTTLNKCPPKVS